MADMGRGLGFVLAMVMALGWLMPAAAQQSPNKVPQPSPDQKTQQPPGKSAPQPQDKSAPESGNPYDDTAPYAPPAPWKSVEIGNYYFRKRNLRAALSRYKEAVQTDPHYAAGYLGLGRIYEKMGLKKQALESYQRYLDELPSTRDALEAKDVQKSMAKLEKQLKLPASHRGKPAPPATQAH